MHRPLRSPTVNTAMYDPFDEATRRDPYPAYRRLRREHPVYYNEGRDFWTLARFADVQAALRDWRRFSSAEGTAPTRGRDTLRISSFLSMDPPRHDVVRDAVKDAFAMRNVSALEDAVRAQVDELVAGFAGRGSTDLATELAWPLPVGVISRLLDVPLADVPELQRLFHEFMVINTIEPGEIDAGIRDAAKGLRAYFEQVVDGPPRGGIVAALQAAVGSGTVTADEAVRVCIFLLIAGFETTAGLLANAFLLLALHPEQRALLARDPAAIRAGVEEVLRYESPIQLFARTTTEEVELHGEVIPRGARVLMLVGAANRDEERFENGEVFDVARKPVRHLAFGEGIHHCLGSLLARLEGRIAIERVLAAMPGFELDGEPAPMNSVSARGLYSLPVRWDPDQAPL